MQSWTLCAMNRNAYEVFLIILRKLLNCFPYSQLPNSNNFLSLILLLSIYSIVPKYGIWIKFSICGSPIASQLKNHQKCIQNNSNFLWIILFDSSIETPKKQDSFTNFVDQLLQLHWNFFYSKVRDIISHYSRIQS